MATVINPRPLNEVLSNQNELNSPISNNEQSALRNTVTNLAAAPKEMEALANGIIKNKIDITPKPLTERDFETLSIEELTRKVLLNSYLTLYQTKKLDEKLIDQLEKDLDRIVMKVSDLARRFFWTIPGVGKLINQGVAAAKPGLKNQLDMIGGAMEMFQGMLTKTDESESAAEQAKQASKASILQSERDANQKLGQQIDQALQALKDNQSSEHQAKDSMVR